MLYAQSSETETGDVVDLSLVLRSRMALHRSQHRQFYDVRSMSRCVRLLDQPITPEEMMAYWCDDRSLNLEQRRLDAARRERLEEEWHRLQNSFGYGPFYDGKIRDRIAALDRQLAQCQ